MSGLLVDSGYNPIKPNYMKPDTDANLNLLCLKMLISENSYFSDCLFHDITINNCKGLKNAFFENINFGTIETPVILSDEKALQYLLNYNI